MTILTTGSCLMIVMFIFVHVNGIPVLVGEEVPTKKVVEVQTDDSFDSILRINDEHAEEFYEGDIVLPKTRNAVQDKTLRWGLTVPYEIHEQYSYEKRSKIISALNEMEVRSCLTFIPRTTETDYLFYEIGSGCHSLVGANGGKQTVSIGNGCDNHRTIIHETLHALGFWHEQSRTDRDDYVEIVWDAITPGQEHNFEKHDSDILDTLGVPYDYDSVMHYSDTAFSKNGSKTIIPLKPGGEDIGKKAYLSKIDVEELNILYEGQPILDEFGYTEWTEWSLCDINCKRERKRFCDGDVCATWGEEEVQTSDCDNTCQVGYDVDCGPTLITGISGDVSSPLFPYSYKSNSDCIQTIQVAEEARIQLHFQTLDIEDYAGGCYYDFLHVYDGKDINAPKIGTFCSTKMPGVLVSRGNTLTLKFTSDGSVEQRGYNAKFYATAAKETVCEFENDNDYCGWEHDTSVELTFTRNSGKTSSADTGPAADHTFGNDAGNYLFLEASAPAANGQRARLISPTFPASRNDFCFSFWYNMYGGNIGSLKVYLVIDGVFTTLTSHYGNKMDDDWYQDYVTIPTSNDFQIAIEAVRGNGYMGDIAIDDVAVQEGSCP